MSDYNLWLNDIEYRFSPTSLTDALNGSLYTATAVVSGVTTNSAPKMSQWDAYLDLRNKLLGVSEIDGGIILPKSTTVELTALTGIIDGQGAQNITTGRDESCLGSAWVSSAGAGRLGAAAYGNMFEDSATGSPTNSTTKQWITANGGVFDRNGLVSFSDNALGDRLVVGTGGAGDYMVVASCGQTNSGSNRTTMTVRINDVASTVIKDDQNANATNHRALVANGILTLADGDYLTMHIVDPDTPANEIKVFDCHLTIQRIS